MKRLVRSRTDRKLSGLCAGIADYFNTDVTIIRLLVLCLVVFTFPAGPIVYIIAAVITPEEGEPDAKD